MYDTGKYKHIILHNYIRRRYIKMAGKETVLGKHRKEVEVLCDF